MIARKTAVRAKANNPSAALMPTPPPAAVGFGGVMAARSAWTNCVQLGKRWSGFLANARSSTCFSGCRHPSSSGISRQCCPAISPRLLPGKGQAIRAHLVPGDCETILVATAG